MFFTTLPSYPLQRACLLAGALFLLSSLKVAALTGSDAGSEIITGPANVVDGDTLDIHGTRIRLEGIDAPETSQTCGTANGGTWPCGLTASAKLRALISGRDVTCQVQGLDKYRRALAYCSAAGVELNRAMVETGHAWAFVKYSTVFVDAEAAAKASRTGIWQGPATPAWDYRSGAWQTAESTAPTGCAIKGNISDRGRIYHMPWNAMYGRVRIDESAGERWFCDEAEATAAGWRPAKNH